MIPEIKPYMFFKEFASQFKPDKDAFVKFEKEFASFSGFPYALFFPWARSGLAYLLEALGHKHKKIITPAYTCLVVPQAIVWSQNIPFFIDNSQKNINMDNQMILDHLDDDTSAVVITSLFGRKHDPEGIVEPLKDRGILTISDVSLAFGVTHQKIPVSHFADIGIYSTNAGKPLSAYGGGFLTFKNRNIYNLVKAQRNKSIKNTSTKRKIITQLSFNFQYIAFQKWMYGLVAYLKENTSLIEVFTKQNEDDLSIPPQHYDLPANFQAKIGLVQIDRFIEMEVKRKQLAQFYAEYIKETELLSVIPFEKEDSLSHYHIRVKAGFRNIFRKYLLKNGIAFGVHFDYSNPYLKMFKEFKNIDAPESKIWADEMVTIPFYPGLKRKDAQKVVDVINNFIPN